jgi:hypothetical protein
VSHQLLADLVVLLHLTFILFAAFGGLLAIRWRGVMWVHLPTLTWAAFVELTGRICPLTPLENWLRRAAGEAGYEGDFIAHYIVPIVYPIGLTRTIQIALGAILILGNAGIYAIVWRRSVRR